MKKLFLLLIGINLIVLPLNAQIRIYTPGAGIYASGNSWIGIGTSSPQRPLHVALVSYFQAFVGIGTSNPIQPLHVSGTSYFDGNVGIGTSSPIKPLQVNGTSYFNGNVGMGISTPVTPLHVVGTSYFNGSVGIGTSAPSQNFELKNGNLLLSNTGTAYSLMFAEPSGYGTNFTSFKAQPQSTDITYTLPAGYGTNGQVLSTDGGYPTSILSWSTPSSGSITQVGSMTSSVVFANSSANNQWLGLGSSAGRIQFLDQAIDKVNILDAYVGIGTTNPIQSFHVAGVSYFNDKVGIGVTAPSVMLEVSGSSGNTVEVKATHGNTAIAGTSTYAGDNNYTSGVEGFSYHGHNANYGLYGYVEGEYNDQTPPYNYGVRGEAAMSEYGYQYGGYFVGYGTVDHRIGVYAACGSPDWAAFFDGDTYCVGLYQTSDRKFKENIKDIPSALELINKIEPREFTFKNSPEFKMLNLPKGKNFGFVAQELETVLPQLVTDVNHPPQVDKKGNVINEGISYKAVNYISLIPILTQSIKEQQEIINNQSIKIEEMEKELNNIKNQLGLKDMINNAILSPIVNSIPGKQTILFQNNPNPFSIETSIEFNIAEKFSTASLCVYNLQGTQLKKYDIQSNGIGKITIHANEFVAGIYLYTLLVDNKEIATKRMILTQ